MKRIINMLFFIAFYSAALSQNSLSSTYTAGDIPTSYLAYDNSCNGPSATLSLLLPAGDNYTITNVTVAYSMTAQGSSWKSDQRSKIKFENNAAIEATDAVGVGNTPGIQTYNRSIAFANGTYTGGTQLNFQLLANRIFNGTPGCNTSTNKVDAGSWTITVFFSNVITNPKVGINTTTPRGTLDVKGGIILGEENTNPVAGTIKWNEANKDFEGYNGSRWLSLTQKENGVGWGFTSAKEYQNAGIIGGLAGDYFGKSVSIEGDYAVIGADAKSVLRGKAYIFRRSNGTYWNQSIELAASDALSGDVFGSSVAISGDYVIIGAPQKFVGTNDRQGKAYIFKRSGSTWAEEAGLTASDGTAFDFFGKTVAISGDYAIIGASDKKIGANFFQGKVYIFKRTGTTWAQQAGITPADAAADDKFGQSVSLSGDYAIISADEKTIAGNNRQGKVYIFKRSGTNWTEQAGLLASDATANDRFGKSVSISGNYAIVGASNKTVGTLIGQGKVYVFKRNNTNWIQEAGFTSLDSAALFGFGQSVSISGDHAVVSCAGGLPSSGSAIFNGDAFLFKRSGTNWFQQATFSSGVGFGNSCVSISGNDIIIGDERVWGPTGSSNVGRVFFYMK